MEASARKSFILQSLKAGVFSLIFACIGVLVLALLAKLFGISEGVLPVVNQVLKALACFFGVLLCVKEEKFLLKGLAGGAIFWLLSSVLFSLLGGGFHWGQIALDLGISAVVAVIAALLKSRKA